MQGRLSPVTKGKIQEFPWRNWRQEFQLANKLGFSIMEWTLDQEKLYENPLMTSLGQNKIKDLSEEYKVQIPSLTGDCFMQTPFWKCSQIKQRTKLQEDFEAILISSKKVGIKFVVVPLVDNGKIENRYEEDLLVNFLDKLKPILIDLDIRIIFESDFNFVGLRESTVEFVDYDIDGDLDIFISGLSDSGAETILYQVNLPAKVNTAPTEVQNLSVTDLEYGNIKFDWDESSDDFSNAIGYNLKIGTTPGGSELSNTFSNLESGSRLISAAPPIVTNEFQTNLFPGIYYVAVQSIDPGSKASKFSDELRLELLYEWKQLNQGGIVDRNIAGLERPILRLADLDNDDDLDLIYGSEVKWKNDSGTIYDNNFLTSHKFDAEEKRLIRFDRERKTENSLSNLRIHDVTDIQVGLINDDEYPDVIINRYAIDGVVYGESPNLNDLFIHFGKEPIDGGSSNLNEETLIYDQVRLGDGLFEGKVKLADLNNDGQLEILQVGLDSDNTTSGRPKLIIYSYDNDSNNSFSQNDVSDQIEALSNSSFDLGDVDNDQDLDFVITGFDQSSGLKSYLYENISDTGGDFKLELTDNNFAATRDGSIDFFDYDTDGDLDILITGTGTSGDIFEIYVNKLNEDITDWPRLNTIDIPGLRHSKIEYGDFNGDNYIDISYTQAVGDGNSTEQIFFINNGDNTFYVDNDFSINSFPFMQARKTIVGDFNDDGKPDIVRPHGAHGFHAQPTITLSSENGYEVVLLDSGPVYHYHTVSSGDIDNDGDLDLFFAENQQFDGFMINDGMANFSWYGINDIIEGAQHPGGLYTSDMTDIDNDGNIDLIVGGIFRLNDENGRLLGPTIFWGDGSGKFSFDDSTILYKRRDISYANFGGPTHDFAVNDIDGDGLKDIALQSGLDETNSSTLYQVFFATGNRTFEDRTEQVMNTYKVNSPGHVWIILRDIDNDGNMDLVEGEPNLDLNGSVNRKSSWWRWTGSSFVKVQ